MLHASLASLVPTAPKADTALCAHCGTRTESRGDDQPAFCCAGCETVYGLVRSAGLDEYYAFCDRLGEASLPADTASGATPPGEFCEFDSPQFRALFSETHDDSYKVTFSLEGLHCAACVWLIERLPRIEPDVESARVDFGRRLVELTVKDGSRPLSAIARSLAKLGYRPSTYRVHRAETETRRELNALLLRIGVAGAIAGNVMLMAFALYSGDSGSMDGATRRFFELGSFVLALGSLWAGGLFFRGALASLRLGAPHMDLPIAIGISAGYLSSGYAALSGRGAIYFDSLTVLIFLLLIGRYLTRKHQMSAAQAAELLTSVTPAVATLVEENESRAVPIETLEIGSIVSVASGETVPVDGVVVAGSSTLDLSILSGESLPVVIAPGDEVIAGASNIGSPLTIRVSAAGLSTKVASLLREVERALLTRTPLIALADRVAAVFTWAIIAIAAAVYALWLFRDPERALPTALALLVVSCPCALAMATPLAFSAASSQAARLRILLFEVSALERLARPSDIYLDKTGTLTSGRLRVTTIAGDAELLPAVLAAESISRHPIARSVAATLEPLITREAADSARALLDEHSEVLGAGVVARFGGKELRVGSESFVQGALASREVQSALDRRSPLESPLFVAFAGRIELVLFLADELREGAAESLRTLHSLGHRLHLLSGDHPGSVDAVADELTRAAGVENLLSSVRGGVRPLEKLDVITSALGRGREIVMVGDGVNDAAALARADVGISVHGAAEASRLSADVFLGNGGVAQLTTLVVGARRTMRTVRRGMIFSLLYNAAGISLAAMGALSPLWAAILMPLSSLTVVSNAYKSRLFGEKS